MTTLSCIILDDEAIAIQHLAKYVAKVPFLHLNGSFMEPTQAMQYLAENPVDLVFLDVEMPNFPLDGMDFIRIMGERYRYIFTTAYPQYALPSYEYNAVDFLHKPFSFDRFMKAVQKARQSIDGSSDSPAATLSDEVIYVRAEGRLQRIRFDEICWIESERNYISIFTETGRINVVMSISEMEKRLPARLFARVQKSYIVAYSRVEIVEKEQIQIKRDGTHKWIPMGEQFKKPFIQTIEAMTLKK
jgi:DNA-binding LytR/AlgR family response regulator